MSLMTSGKDHLTCDSGKLDSCEEKKKSVLTGRDTTMIS